MADKPDQVSAWLDDEDGNRAADLTLKAEDYTESVKLPAQKPGWMQREHSYTADGEELEGWDGPVPVVNGKKTILEFSEPIISASGEIEFKICFRVTSSDVSSGMNCTLTYQLYDENGNIIMDVDNTSHSSNAGSYSYTHGVTQDINNVHLSKAVFVYSISFTANSQIALKLNKEFWTIDIHYVEGDTEEVIVDLADSLTYSYSESSESDQLVSTFILEVPLNSQLSLESIIRDIEETADFISYYV